MVFGHCLRTSERNWLPVMPGMRSSETTHVDVVAREDHQTLLRRIGGEDLELLTVETAHQGRSEIRLVVDQK